VDDIAKLIPFAYLLLLLYLFLRSGRWKTVFCDPRANLRKSWRNVKIERVLSGDEPVPELFLFFRVQARQLWGAKADEVWLKRIEPQLRSDKSEDGYPADWFWRREFVLQGAGGKCSRPACSNPPKHVHHEKHLSKGGDHSLGNLEPLCPSCHAGEHPQNPILNPHKRYRSFRRKMQRQLW